MDTKTIVQEFLALPEIANIIAQTGYLDKVYDKWNSYYSKLYEGAIKPEALTAYLDSLKINVLDYFESCLPSSVFSYHTIRSETDDQYEVNKVFNLPERISEIESFAFSDQPKLETFYTGNNSQLQIIGPYAFHHCDNLKHFTFPEKLQSIGMGAFFGCHNLTHLIFKSALSIATVARSPLCFINQPGLKVISIERGCIQDTIQLLTSSKFYNTVDVLQYAGSIDDFMQEFHMNYPEKHDIFTYLPMLSKIQFMQGNQQVLVNQAK